jgi:hypothetical protein
MQTVLQPINIFASQLYADLISAPVISVLTHLLLFPWPLFCQEKLGQLQILIKHIISSQDLVARTDMQLEATRLKVSVCMCLCVYVCVGVCVCVCICV